MRSEQSLGKVSKKIRRHVKDRLANAGLRRTVAKAALGARDATVVRGSAQIVRILVGDELGLGGDRGHVHHPHGGLEAADDGTALTQQNGYHDNNNQDGEHVECAFGCSHPSTKRATKTY